MPTPQEKAVEELSRLGVVFINSASGGGGGGGGGGGAAEETSVRHVDPREVYELLVKAGNKLSEVRSNKLTTIAKATSILDSCGFIVIGPNNTSANSVIVRMIDPRRGGVAVRVDPVEFTLSYQCLCEAGYTITPLTTTSPECGYSSSSSSSSLSSVNHCLLQEVLRGECRALKSKRELLQEVLQEECRALKSERELLQAERQALREERQALREERQALLEARRALQEEPQADQAHQAHQAEQETLRNLADQINQVHNLIANNNNNDVIINIPNNNRDNNNNDGNNRRQI